MNDTADLPGSAPAGAPVPALGNGPLVVATDGAEHSDAALHAAWSLAGRTNADVHVLSVVEPVAPVGEIAGMVPPPADSWESRRTARLAVVQAQLRRVFPAGCDWAIQVVEGDQGVTIAQYARAQRARLLVVGRGRHGLAHRLVEPEVVLRVLRSCDVPVLATEAPAVALPQRVVVAVDFSQYSTYAARVAIAMSAPDAIIYLAHVRPSPVAAGATAVLADQLDEEALSSMFSGVVEQLRLNDGLQLETVRLVGQPGQALIDFARASGADLVVCGTHGRGFIARLMLGSVATDLLRRVPCSLLCVPGSAVHRNDPGA